MPAPPPQALRLLATDKALFSECMVEYTTLMHNLPYVAVYDKDSVKVGAQAVLRLAKPTGHPQLAARAAAASAVALLVSNQEEQWKQSLAEVCLDSCVLFGRLGTLADLDPWICFPSRILVRLDPIAIQMDGGWKAYQPTNQPTKDQSMNGGQGQGLLCQSGVAVC